MNEEFESWTYVVWRDRSRSSARGGSSRCALAPDSLVCPAFDVPGQGWPSARGGWRRTARPSVRDTVSA